MKVKIIRYSLTSLATLGLGIGMAAASSINLGTSGPGSINQASINNNPQQNLQNNNLVSAINGVLQISTSGAGNVSGNTNGGSATSGGSSNFSSIFTSLVITNSGGLWSFGLGNDSVSLNTTGPGSTNQASVNNNQQLNRTNNNTVTISNSCQRGGCGQTATSGSVNVSGNTNGGSATSSAASNNNNESNSITVSN